MKQEIKLLIESKERMINGTQRIENTNNRLKKVGLVGAT